MAPSQQNEFAKWSLRRPASYAHGSEAPGTDLPQLDTLVPSPIRPGVGSSAVRGRGRDRARFVVGVGIGLGLGRVCGRDWEPCFTSSERSRVVVVVVVGVGVVEPCIASSERGPPGLGLGRVLVFFVEPCIASSERSRVVVVVVVGVEVDRVDRHDRVHLSRLELALRHWRTYHFSSEVQAGFWCMVGRIYHFSKNCYGRLVSGCNGVSWLQWRQLVTMALRPRLRHAAARRPT